MTPDIIVTVSIIGSSTAIDIKATAAPPKDELEAGAIIGHIAGQLMVELERRYRAELKKAA